MDQRLILADGTTYENGGCGEMSNNLYCNIRGNHDIADVASNFLNPAKTGTITMEAGDVTTTFNGYTRVTNISQVDASTITVVLNKSGGET